MRTGKHIDVPRLPNGLHLVPAFPAGDLRFEYLVIILLNPDPKIIIKALAVGAVKSMIPEVSFGNLIMTDDFVNMRLSFWTNETNGTFKACVSGSNAELETLRIGTGMTDHKVDTAHFLFPSKIRFNSR